MSYIHSKDIYSKSLVVQSQSSPGSSVILRAARPGRLSLCSLGRSMHSIDAYLNTLQPSIQPLPHKPLQQRLPCRARRVQRVRQSAADSPFPLWLVNGSGSQQAAIEVQEPRKLCSVCQVMLRHAPPKGHDKVVRSQDGTAGRKRCGSEGGRLDGSHHRRPQCSVLSPKTEVL